VKKKLSTLRIGDTGFIDSFTDEELSLKFLEMGCLPGEQFFLERIAPLGDPIAIKIGDSSLCLRRDEAAGITVTMTSKG
jgi:ferrous iron transport protein A